MARRLHRFASGHATSRRSRNRTSTRSSDIVHYSENFHGILVSLDDKAALIRANFIEGRIDYRQLFYDVNKKIMQPFQDHNIRSGSPVSRASTAGSTTTRRRLLVSSPVTYCIEWVLALDVLPRLARRAASDDHGLIAAFWGLGSSHLIGFALDPLMLVMPFLITARAVSHAIQMHDRYYEEFSRTTGTSAGDRRGVRRALRADVLRHHHRRVRRAGDPPVPVVMLQKLAITASWWILAITISELLLNPIVYYYLRAPEPEIVMLAREGWFRTSWIASPTVAVADGSGRDGRLLDCCRGAVGVFMRGLTIGDPTSASPLLWPDSPYNIAHTDSAVLRRRRAADRRRRRAERRRRLQGS